jgi:hypothetical protein
MISTIKFIFYMIEMIIIRYICNIENRHSEFFKVFKILKWIQCNNLMNVWAFLNIYEYYRIWIKYYTFITELIYRLFHYNKAFKWKLKQIKVIKILKNAIIMISVLIKINYELNTEEIITTFNVSTREWDAILIQLNKKERKYLIKYKSGI